MSEISEKRRSYGTTSQFKRCARAGTQLPGKGKGRCGNMPCQNLKGLRHEQQVKSQEKKSLRSCFENEKEGKGEGEKSNSQPTRKKYKRVRTTSKKMRKETTRTRLQQINGKKEGRVRCRSLAEKRMK